MKAIEFALQMLAEGLGFRVATGTAPQQCALLDNAEKTQSDPVNLPVR